VGIPNWPKRRYAQLRENVSRSSLLFGLILAGTIPAKAIVNKPLIQPITTAPAVGSAIVVEADKITFDPKTNNATATGTVVMVYGVYKLTATHVEYNQITGAFKANGSIELREPNGNILQADRISLTEKFKKGFAIHIKALLTNDATITAEYARRVDGNVTIFEHASYTACKNCGTKSGHPIWEIVSDKTTHDKVTHNLHHINPKLKIDGITVLAAPFWTQADPSVHRRTGWLAPYLKFGSAFGVGAVTPYFWAIDPSYDLTFSPMITTQQGGLADIEWRQRLKTGSYNIHGYGIYQLNPLDNNIDNQTWRGAIKTRGDFVIDQDWSWGWQGTYASDQSFLDSYGFDSSIIAENNVHTTGVWDQTYVSAQLLDYRSLNKAVNPDFLPKALPYITGEKIIPDTVLGGDLQFNWNVYSIHRDDADTPILDVNHGTDQTRASGSVEWKTQLISEGGVVVSPFARLRTDVYMTNNVPDPTIVGGFRDNETTSRILPTVGVDMRYPLIASTGSGQNIISPVFQLISASDETAADQIGNEDAITLNLDSSSLFLTDRFTGLDKFETGTRANLGVTYSFLGGTRDYVRASLGESVHIAGENSFFAGSGLNGTQSDLVASIVAMPLANITLAYEARVEEDLSKINRQEAVASLNFDSFSTRVSYLNFGAEPLYGRPLAEHWISADMKYKFDNGWNVFGGLSYDFHNNSVTRKTAGVEFDCDCMNFKLAYIGSQDALTLVNTNAIMASIEFATLGGTGFTSKF
jgi:LPS-assembly protein